jgi:hypothetical protein
LNGFEGEVAGSEVTEQADFRLPSQPSRDQVGHLGQDEGRDDQRAGVGFEQLEACEVVGVVGVDIGVQRASVEDQRDESASARMISSIRSEISL